MMSHGQFSTEVPREQRRSSHPAHMDAGHRESCAFTGMAAVALLTTEILRIRDTME